MRIHSVESMAALDGEGLRCAVFLTGCPLRCAYCHNPDTWNPDAGEETTPAALATRLRRFLPYFRASGGGVTFSGGEPLLSAKEINETAKLLRSDGIGYTLDSSGCVPLTEDVRQAVDGAELVIADLKFPDEADFCQWTGGELSLVTAFFGYLKETGKRVWVRTVIVPGINDREECVARAVEFLRKYAGKIEKYELLGFHTMGFFKYEKLGIRNPLASVPPLPQERLAALQAFANGVLQPADNK